MAIIEPFRGLRFNLQHIQSMADVVSPPYDVINAEQQARYYQNSPFNIVRLEWGQTHPDDGPHSNAHTRAARDLAAWCKQGVLVQDPSPALYLSATEFEGPQGPCTRWGLIARVGLEPFGRGGILPHERTFAKVKSERLALMEACRANISPIFAFFDDRQRIVARLAQDAQRRAPEVDFMDEDAHRHRLWVVSEPGCHREVTAAFKDCKLYIADGHHRYETALAYRDKLIDGGHALAPNHPAQGTLMYLCDLHDSGLVVLPTHRILPDVADAVRRDFLDRAEPYFTITSLPVSHAAPQTAAQKLMTALTAMQPGRGIGVVRAGEASIHVLQLRDDAAARIYRGDLAPPLRRLEVTLLAEFVFPHLMEMRPEQQDDVQQIRYRHDAADVIAAVSSSHRAMGFILRSTPVDLVQEIAQAGLIMPRKTTYFTPKVITGLVMQLLEPSDQR